jgi:hypothetical protein
MNGGVFDSSDEEEEEELALAGAAVRAVGASVKAQGARGGVKGVRGECGHSVTGTTEDSGMESAAKSSQDEREALSLLESNLAHDHSAQGSHPSGLADHRAGMAGHLSGHSGGLVPEFFLPTEQLQASMRALKLATSAANTHAQNESPQVGQALSVYTCLSCFVLLFPLLLSLFFDIFFLKLYHYLSFALVEQKHQSSKTKYDRFSQTFSGFDCAFNFYTL